MLAWVGFARNSLYEVPGGDWSRRRPGSGRGAGSAGTPGSYTPGRVEEGLVHKKEPDLLILQACTHLVWVGLARSQRYCL